MDFQSNQPDLQAIERIVDNFCGLHKEILGAFIFGSTVTERRHDSSDVDVAFLLIPEHAANPTRLSMEYAAELERDLKTPVHAIIFNTAAPLLRSQIVRKGRIIFARDRAAVKRAAAQAMIEFYDEIVPLERLQKRILERNRIGR